MAIVLSKNGEDSKTPPYKLYEMAILDDEKI
jgi:hypothetical protein